MKSRFWGYLAGSQRWKFWEPSTNTFIESAHAGWPTEEAEDSSGKEVSNSQPIPDKPSSIGKLVDFINCEEKV